MKYIKMSDSTADEYRAHINLLRSDSEYKLSFDEFKKSELINWWKKIDKRFVVSSDVPNLPIPLTDFFTKRLIDLGAIPKSELIDGCWYYGNYRNSKLGKWSALKEKFDHIRYSFGFYWDDCNHFQADNGYALFTPIREATEEEIDIELKSINK